MFSWLQAKLKHCRLLSRAIDKIKDSSPLSSKRTVNWLWAQLVELLDELREEAKEESITQSGMHCCGPWPKAHLHRRKESNRKQHQHRPPAPPDGPLERVEQKGKGDKDKDKGKGKGDARLTEKAKVQRPKAKLCQRKTHPKRHVFSFRKANGAAATAKSSAAAVALMLPTTARGISVDGPPTPSTTTFWKRSGLSNLFRTVIGWFSVCSHALPAVLPSVSFFITQTGPFHTDWIADSGTGRNLTSLKGFIATGYPAGSQAGCYAFSAGFLCHKEWGLYFK